MLLVNGHGGNVAAIKDALATLRAEGRDCHVWHAGVRPALLAAAGIAPPGQARSGPAHVVLREAIRCPRCGSVATEEVARFGSTACKAQYRCRDCLEPFDHFKPH